MPASVWKTLAALLIFFLSALAADSSHTNQTTTRELSGGERHTTNVSLSTGQYLSVRVEQEGIDVVVALRGPDGKLLAEVNRPIGAHGPELLHGVAETSGLHVIETRAANREAHAGHYSLTIATPRPAQANDALLVAAQRALGEGRSLRASGLGPRLENAVTVLAAAVRNFTAAGDSVGAADALIEQGRTVHFLGDAKTAAAHFEQARQLYVQAGERHGEALALFRYGGAAAAGWQESFQHTLELARALGNRFLEAKALREMGHDTGIGGKHSEGIVLVRAALKIHQTLGYRYDEAEALLSLGWMLNDLGDLQEGTEEYLKAERLHREDNNRRELANALLYVADGRVLLGEYERARDAVSEALELARAGRHKLVEILALLKFSDVCLRLGQPAEALKQLQAALPLSELTSYHPRILKALGQTYLALGQNEQALDFLSRAFELYQSPNLRSGRADVNFYLAQTYEQLGQLDRAQTEYARTLADFQQRDERLGVARTLLAQAKLQATQGDFDAARARNETALTLLESLRKGLNKYSERATFFAATADAYTQQIEMLLRGAPTTEQSRAAFAVSERARARALLDMLAEARVTQTGEVDTALLTELRETQQRLNDEAVRRLATPTADARLRELAAEVEAVRARLRTANPHLAALTQPQPLTAAETQALLDDDSLLLEYALGEEKSFVWALTAQQITVYELPKRAAIETAARTLHRLLADGKPHQSQAAALSRMLLGPVAAHLQQRRLLVVADGALQYVPFAALPHPQAAAPLLVSNEIVNLPSASVLAVLRREFAARQPAPRTVAVFADPVFSRDDARVKTANLAQHRPPARETVRGAGDLQRLPSSRTEAEAIRTLAPPAATLVVRDFAADRAALLQTDLTPYRIIHFATHGLLDDTHPALSSLVLSLVDEAGRPRDGFLRLHEIYNLKLNADLVVLSACQTALGKEIKGEGLIGLTRGFMYAGTPRVVASLWQVNSTATANLMKVFYRGLLRNGLRPAAALRAAQLELRRQGLSPYDWGAFVLQGEWR